MVQQTVENGSLTDQEEYTIENQEQGSKSIFIQENFIESTFNGLKEAITPPQELPLWAYGLDRKLDFPNGLNSNLGYQLNGINRIASNYIPPTVSGQETILNYQKQLEDGEITLMQMEDKIKAGLIAQYELPEDTGIFLAPSEASAQLMVLMILRYLY